MSEPDSLVFQIPCCVRRPAFRTAEITILELRRVAFSKEAAGLLQPGAAEATLAQMEADVDAGTVEVVEQSRAVKKDFDQLMAACYRQTPPLPLRTLDGLHLASARVAAQTEVVATDKRLREAAKLLGFTLFPA